MKHTFKFLVFNTFLFDITNEINLAEKEKSRFILISAIAIANRKLTISKYFVKPCKKTFRNHT